MSYKKTRQTEEQSLSWETSPLRSTAPVGICRVVFIAALLLLFLVVSGDVNVGNCVSQLREME